MCNRDVDIIEVRPYTDYVETILSCGHTPKKYARSIIEPSIQVSDNVLYNIIKDPIGEISRARSEKDYFKAITYSCTVFEYYGKQVLVWYFAENNTPVSKDRLEGISLEPTIIMLYTHRIIDDHINGKILEVKKLRS
jgi:hypothetical protein